ncbi:MAG: addiction module protein [Gammaproteobacteria bacterium]|nr:addiction module protein [Gammaproteobacteria bacterium]
MSVNIKDLPISEKVRLVEDLWDSIASDQESLPLTQEQKIELDRRLVAYEADGDLGRPAGEAVKDIRSRL